SSRTQVSQASAPTASASIETATLDFAPARTSTDFRLPAVAAAAPSDIAEAGADRGLASLRPCRARKRLGRCRNSACRWQRNSGSYLRSFQKHRVGRWDGQAGLEAREHSRADSARQTSALGIPQALACHRVSAGLAAVADCYCPCRGLELAVGIAAGLRRV